MNRPVAYKKLYRFTPFNMNLEEDSELSSIRYWVGEYLYSLVNELTLKDMGYVGASLALNTKDGNAPVMDITFRADKAVDYVIDSASGKAIPKIKKHLKGLRDYFFFGPVEDCADLGTQTITHYRKNKDGEIKVDRMATENDVEVLTIHANPILVLCGILDVSPASRGLEFRVSPMTGVECANFAYFVPEAYGSTSPCRVNVIVDSDSVTEFDPEDVENNLYGTLRLDEEIRRYAKEYAKSIKAAAEASYENNVGKKRVGKKADKKMKNKNKEYGGM